MSQALYEFLDLVLLEALLSQIEELLVLARLEHPLEQLQKELVDGLEQKLDVDRLEAA